DALHAGNPSEIHASVFALLPAGHTEVACAYFVNQIWSKDVRMTDRRVPASSHDLIAKAGNERFVEITIPIGLKSHQIRTGEASQYRVVRRDRMVDAGCKLIAVVFDGRRAHEILHFTGGSGQRNFLKKVERDRTQALARNSILLEGKSAAGRIRL